MFKASLQYTTTVWVGGQIVYMPLESTDKPQTLWGYVFDELLNHLFAGFSKSDMYSVESDTRDFHWRLSRIAIH